MLVVNLEEAKQRIFLLQSQADENDKTTLNTLLIPIDNEFQFLKNKVMSLNLNENQIDFKFIFEGAEFDEKMDRAKLNMEGTGQISFAACVDAKELKPEQN